MTWRLNQLSTISKEQPWKFLPFFLSTFLWCRARRAYRCPSAGAEVLQRLGSKYTRNTFLLSTRHDWHSVYSVLHSKCRARFSSPCGYRVLIMTQVLSILFGTTRNKPRITTPFQRPTYRRFCCHEAFSLHLLSTNKRTKLRLPKRATHENVNFI